MLQLTATPMAMWGAVNWAERGPESLREFDPAMLYTTAFLQSDDITLLVLRYVGSENS
ncbi:MAG: hypothetical protein HC782_05030 [Gammaproteobacteria bacterium]|nr:hypothetical protein [Gammaproteobacteria bacterium]